MTKKLRIAPITITGYTKDGLGKGTLVTSPDQSHEVHIPFTVPGDEVYARISKKRKGAREGEALDWITYAENRITPRCKHFGSCGGCSSQHITYNEELLQKEAKIHSYLDPLLSSTSLWHPIIPAPLEWYYRNKMELSFSSDKKGNHYLGLILHRTRGLVFQMEECYLFNPWIIDAVGAVSLWWKESEATAWNSRNDTGSLRTLTLREGQRTGDRMVVLTVSGNPEYALKKKQLDTLVATLKQTCSPPLPEQKLSLFLRIQQTAKGSPTQFYEMLLYGPDHIREILHIDTGEEKHSLTFRISPTAFFQPNTTQAEKLYSKAIQLTQVKPGSIVYDLYCGTGTLGICMAKKAKAVISIELSPESALDARENIKHNNLSNVTIHTGDVGKVLPKLLSESTLRPDALIIDPPRAGLSPEAIENILSTKAPLITYISCNVATQSLNLIPFLQNNYRIESIQPIDQFPRTTHVENIVTLSLGTSSRDP